ncbi:MAG TPA: hypothetical protein PLG90_07650 [Ignavibacteria bacterium]|nr:hypothetical protein [Ignavibacteria bacterium]
MSKVKTNKQSLPLTEKAVSYDNLDLINKYFWLVIPIFAVIYFISSRYSVGFYQDDEIGQYLNMIQFWSDPFAILGNNPKPGYKIFLVVPALISYDAVLITNALIASTTVFLTYILLRVYQVKFAYFGALLLGFQPLFFDLSFRSYSEIFTALCLILVLICYEKKYLILSALLMGYVFTIRQELGLLIVVFLILFIRDKKYLPALILFVFPVIYNLLGYIKTGDIMFVMTEMSKVAGLEYKSQGLMHYFKVYIYIVGPVSLTLFLIGFFSFLKKDKLILKKYFLFYIIFISVFIIQMLTMINDGPNPGNWRYLLHISPVCALFATIGLNNLADDNYKNKALIISGVFAFLVFIFLSKTTDGFILTDTSDYKNFFIIIAIIAFTFMFSSKSKVNYINNLSTAYIILSIVSLFLIYEPKKLSAENLSVKEVASFISEIPEIKSKQIFSNHSILQFYSVQSDINPNQINSINKNNLNSIKSGSIVIWENHYGFRPEWGSDVNINDLINNPDYTLLKQFNATDRRFQAYVFERK